MQAIIKEFEFILSKIAETLMGWANVERVSSWQVRSARPLLPLLSLFVLVASLQWSAIGQEASLIDFDKQIKPILSDRCYHCHGPDEQARMADLRLDERDGALQVVLPGDPASSELWSRLISEDPDLVMPPPDSKLQVTPSERELIKAWIQQGAPWKKHWSFEPRALVLPPVVNSDQMFGNEIDQFLMRKLHAERLQFSPVADRAKLIRRVTFDLTGLPPTLAEIDAFLADESPNAYERIVDRLMKSDHYGQRMASDWLDVARYSDTYGYQVDRDRFVWPWRDWVIRAFNKNLAYDQFMVEQIAGDLLPDATDDQILATTFGRLHPQKVEGGSVEEEFRVEYVADRTQTFATAFLGLTMECARCHDHKFDPVTQKEYYQLFSFFNNIDESGLYSFFTGSIPTPTLQLLNEEQKQALIRLKQATQEAEAKRPEESFDLKSPATIRQALELVGREPIESVDFSSVNGRNAQTKDAEGNPAVKLTGDDAVVLKTGNFRRYQPFSISLSLQTPDVKERAVIFHRSRAWTDAGSRGYQLLLEDGKLSASLIHFWPGNAIRVKTKEPVPVNQWVNVSVVYDGSMSAEGLAIFVDGQRAELDIVRDHLTKNITGGGGDNLAIGERFRDRGFTGGQVSQFRVYDRQLSDLEVALAQGSVSLKNKWQRLATDSVLTPKQAETIAQHLRKNRSEDFAAYRGQLLQARKQYCATLDGVKEIMVMREMPQPRPTHVLERGLYSHPQQQVSAATPSVLPEMDSELPRNRLGLARWLTDPQHPLTARVAVNHYWQLIFGAGIVQTPEDFGRQGLPPTHPDLLDWLANDFVSNGWNLKRLLKQMVMSTAYRQSSEVTADLLERDPENKWLARAPSYRLPAEMLRDSVLSSSGLMVDKLGGAPAKPYELAASFKPSSPDSGEGLYRRSLYTYWKRTGPAPVMMALDAAKRDVCRVKRERTSSPLQALAMLNGPQFVEAARALSYRLIEQHGDDHSEEVAVDMFRILTSRRPTEVEVTIIQKLFLSQLDYFKADPDAAREYLSQGKFGDYGASAKIQMEMNTHDFRLGVTPNGDEALAGKFGRAQLFASELNADQIRQLAEAGPRENVSIGSTARISNQIPDTFQKVEGLPSPWVDDHVVFPKTSKLVFPDGFTLEAWLHPDQIGRGRIWDKVTPGTGDGVFLDLHQGLRFFVGGIQVMGSRSPQAGRWSHVVCAVNTKDGRIRMYLDGELVGRSGPEPKDQPPQDLPLLAAWSSVANTLINHDECVTKR
ncbi:MAG: DUF1553 domain-containing protein [Mariniblastus sp.]|nr:DUF1553 domain-containing protein [Mariniblastus sp.]